VGSQETKAYLHSDDSMRCQKCEPERGVGEKVWTGKEEGGGGCEGWCRTSTRWVVRISRVLGPELGGEKGETVGKRLRDALRGVVKK